MICSGAFPVQCQCALSCPIMSLETSRVVETKDLDARITLRSKDAMLERIVQDFLKRILMVKLMPQPSPAMYLAKEQTAAMRM